MSRRAQDPGAARLAAALKRLRAARLPLSPSPPPPLDLGPCTPFEVAVAEQIKAIREDLERLESRLWWLFALIIGAAVANVALSLLAG